MEAKKTIFAKSQRAIPGSWVYLDWLSEIKESEFDLLLNADPGHTVVFKGMELVVAHYGDYTPETFGETEVYLVYGKSQSMVVVKTPGSSKGVLFRPLSFLSSIVALSTEGIRSAGVFYIEQSGDKISICDGMIDIQRDVNIAKINITDDVMFAKRNIERVKF